MMTVSKKRKTYLIDLPLLAVLVIVGILLYKSTSTASSDDLTKEQIYRIHQEYIESVYGADTGFRIESYGESGIGRVNHETGEVTWDVTDDKR